jgi:ferredoxin-thioredoxin reductase catalytic subunit
MTTTEEMAMFLSDDKEEQGWQLCPMTMTNDNEEDNDYD